MNQKPLMVLNCRCVQGINVTENVVQTWPNIILTAIRVVKTRFYNYFLLMPKLWLLFSLLMNYMEGVIYLNLRQFKACYLQVLCSSNFSLLTKNKIFFILGRGWGNLSHPSFVVWLATCILNLVSFPSAGVSRQPV